MVLIDLLILMWLAYAILREVEKRRLPLPRPNACCPACSGTVEEDWIICPHCRHLLQDHCRGCGDLVAAYHSFCPWCGVSQEEAGR